MNHKYYEIGVIGAGAWGTTLAAMLKNCGTNVLLWVYEPEVVEQIETHSINRTYLPDIKLPDDLPVTNVPSDFSGIDRLLFVVPSKFCRQTLEIFAPHISDDAWILSATKGFVGPNLQRPTQLFEQMLPGNPIGALSGPNLSGEIAIGLPAITLVSSKNEALVKEFQNILANDTFRVYGGTDVIGTELGGALKNIMAIAGGVADGLHLGENALAALITRGLAEMIRIGRHLGADERTFFGISGLGDLVCTSQSTLSRNHHVGSFIASGRKLTEILADMNAVAEGVDTTRHVYEYAQENKLDLPITEAVYRLLFEDADPGDSLAGLMTRSLKME